MQYRIVLSISMHLQNTPSPFFGALGAMARAGSGICCPALVLTEQQVSLLLLLLLLLLLQQSLDACGHPAPADPPTECRDLHPDTKPVVKAS